MIEKILEDWKNRIGKKNLDYKNTDHLFELGSMLTEQGWSSEAIGILVENLKQIDIVRKKLADGSFGSAYAIKRHNPYQEQKLQKPNLVVEALMKQQEIYKDGGKYATKLLDFIEKQEKLKTDNGDMIVLAKSNLNSKGVGGKDTLKDVLKNPTRDNVMTWFGDGLTKAPLTLKDTNGKMYNLNNIDKGKFSGKSVGGGGKIDAANYEMGICIAHAISNKGMNYKQALSATGIDKSKYEKYREVVEPVGELVAKNIPSYPLVTHSGAGKATVINPYTNATPKTDIFGGADYRISLKQEGGAQLMSGGAADTKGVFVGAKTFWNKYEPGQMDSLLSEVINTIDTDFKKISGDNTVGKIKEKFAKYYMGFRMPVVQREVNDLITKLSKDKKKNAADIKKLKKPKTLEMHIKLELSSLGLGRGSTDPIHIIPGVSQVKPTKVSAEFNNFFKTYDNEDAADEARQVLEQSINIKTSLKPKFDKLWENDIFKKWVVYEAASGNYKFSGDDNLNSSQPAMANRILQFNSKGNIKDVLITPDWAKGYSGKVSSNVGYKTAGKTKITAFRLMTEQGVENPEKYNSLFEYEIEKILKNEQGKLNEGINKIIGESELLQEGFFDNLVKKGKDLVSKLKKALNKLTSKIKNFLKKYFIKIAKKAISKLKEFAKKGFNFFVEALGIDVVGTAKVGKISL